MCRLRNIAIMRDYQESVTTGQTYRWMDRQTPDNLTPMCCYAMQATQKLILLVSVNSTSLTHAQTQLFNLFIQENMLNIFFIDGIVLVIKEKKII